MTKEMTGPQCGECLAPLSGAAAFVFGTVLYNPDGSVHYCSGDGR